MKLGAMTMTTSLIARRHERPALRAALESAGFLVFDASEGGRERERLWEFWAALILLDLPMPRMGGLEVFRRLRGAGDHDPEAILLTHGPIPGAIAALRLGAVDVLARPMTIDAIRAAIEGIVAHAATPRPDPALPRALIAVDPLAFDLLRARRALDRGEFDAAERLLRVALERDPGSAVAHNLMGLLHEGLGEHRASLHSFRASLRADPSYTPALENLRRHCDRFGLNLQTMSHVGAAGIEPGPGAFRRRVR
jgi:DNA-binding response OmpR family regulator